MCRGRILRETLLFATVGLVIELAIVLLIGFGSRPEFLPHLTVSAIGLYIAAASLGYFSGTFLCRRRDFSRTELMGVGVAWSSLVIQTLFGCSLEFIRNAGHNYAFEAYVFRPMFWVALLGTIPAIVLGLAYSWRLKKILSRRESDAGVTSR